MKKRYIQLIFISGLALPGYSQLKVETNAYITTTGNAHVVLDNIDLNVEGLVDQTLGQGTYVFSGSNNNTYSSSRTNTTLDKIIISKPGGKLSLNKSLFVGTSLNFISGHLDYKDNILGFRPGAIMAGESETSGPVSSENGHLYINMNLNAPQQVNPGNLGLTLTSSVNLGSTTIRRRNVTTEVSPGVYSIARMYQIYPTNNSNLNATLRFSYLDDELNGLNEDELTLWTMKTGSWSDEGQTTKSSTENYIEKQGISSFSSWTLAKASSPLPVKLKEFKVQNISTEAITLRWSTTEESQFRNFELERSLNPKNGFTKIAEIDGANSPSGSKYEFADRQFEQGNTYYYRLKMLDIDQTFAYSLVVSVNVEGGKSLMAYPNPAKSEVNLQSDSPIHRACIFSLTGNKIVDVSFSVPNTVQRLPLKGIASGLYMIQMFDASNTPKVEKLMIAQ